MLNYGRLADEHPLLDDNEKRMKKVLDPFRFLLIAVAGWMNQAQQQMIETVTLGFCSAGVKELCNWAPALVERHEHAEQST